jgi:hypothetical protein
MAKKPSYKKKRKSAQNKKLAESKEAKNIEEFLDRVKNSRKCIKAKEYLDNFVNDKENWKFNKMVQVFILNYICVKGVFGKEYFNIFKSYLQKMNVKTKAEFIEKCTKNLQSYQDGTLSVALNSELTFKDTEQGDKMKETLHKRCVYIIENNE